MSALVYPIFSFDLNVLLSILLFYCPFYCSIVHSIVPLFFIRSLQEAVEHSRRPVEVLSIYDTIFKLINETMKRANGTRIAVDNLMNYVSIDERQ